MNVIRHSQHCTPVTISQFFSQLLATYVYRYDAHYSSMNKLINRRKTIRQCMSCQLREKDGGHAIQSAISENLILHEDFTALFSIDFREWGISCCFAVVT